MQRKPFLFSAIQARSAHLEYYHYIASLVFNLMTHTNPFNLP